MNYFKDYRYKISNIQLNLSLMATKSIETESDFQVIGSLSPCTRNTYDSNTLG